MVAISVLDGLGSNAFYTADTRSVLEQAGQTVTYLALPGHPGNHHTQVTGFKEVQAWWDVVLPSEPCILLGYSLGGDLAAAYAMTCSERVWALVLLDAACHDLMAYPEEQELADASGYLSSQVFRDMAEHLSQVRSESDYWSENLDQAERLPYVLDKETGLYRLNLVEKTILDLLRARRQVEVSLQEVALAVPTWVIISDQPTSALEQKQTYLANCPSVVRYAICPKSSHSFVMDQPQSVAERVLEALTGVLDE